MITDKALLRKFMAGETMDMLIYNHARGTMTVGQARGWLETRLRRAILAERKQRKGAA